MKRNKTSLFPIASPNAGVGFFGDESGGVSVFTIYFSLALLIVGGLAVDTSYGYLEKNKLTGVSDAAALAAAQEMPDLGEAQATAIAYVEKNLPTEDYGPASNYATVEFGKWDEVNGFAVTADNPNTVRVKLELSDSTTGPITPHLLDMVGFEGYSVTRSAIAQQSTSTQYSCQYNGLTVGALLDYLFVFTSGSYEAKWYKENYGYVGDIALDGIEADEEAKIKGSMPFEGTLYTNDTTAGEWQDVLDHGSNKQTAELVTEQVELIDGLEVDMFNAIRSIHELEATPGWEDVKGEDLEDMTPISFQNNTDELIVINITDKMKIEEVIQIYGDAGDLIVMRWDEEPDDIELKGKVEFKDGSGIEPMGELTPAHFIHLAAEIKGKGKDEGLLMTPAGVEYDGCGIYIWEKGEITIDGMTSFEGDLCLNKDAEGLLAQNVMDSDPETPDGIESSLWDGHVLLHEDHDGFAYDPLTFIPTGGFVDVFKNPMDDEQDRLKDMGHELKDLKDNTSGGNKNLSLNGNQNKKIKADSSGLTVVEFDSLDTNGGTITFDGDSVFVMQFVGKDADQYFNWHNTKVVLENGASADHIYWVFKEEDTIINFSGDDTHFLGHVASEKKQTVNITDAGTYRGSIFAEFVTITAGINGGPEFTFRPALFIDENNPRPVYVQNTLEPYLSQIPIRPRKGAVFTGYWFVTGKYFWKNVEDDGWTDIDQNEGKDVKIKYVKDMTIIGGLYTPADKFKIKYESAGVHVAPGPGHPFDQCAPLPGLAAALMQ